jgi:hypothetical protein
MAIKEAEHTEPEVVEKVFCRNAQRILGIRR